MKPDYPDTLYNPTLLPDPFVLRITQVPQLYIVHQR